MFEGLLQISLSFFLRIDLTEHFCFKMKKSFEANQLVQDKSNFETTLSNGSLGSRIDEERSKLRKVMRSAAFANHRILERILHPLVHPLGTSSSVSLLTPKGLFFDKSLDLRC